ALSALRLWLVRLRYVNRLFLPRPELFQQSHPVMREITSVSREGIWRVLAHQSLPQCEIEAWRGELILNRKVLPRKHPLPVCYIVSRFDESQQSIAHRQASGRHLWR